MNGKKPRFPTFRRLWRAASPWIGTPWWPSDTLDTKRRSLLQVLLAAAKHRLPAAPLVASMAREERGRYRHRLRRLAQRLKDGVPLPDALERTPGVVSDEQLLAIRFGDQSGTLCTSLQEVLSRDEQYATHMNVQLRHVVFYGVAMLLVAIVVISFILVKIIPAYVAIYDDFDLTAPPATILLVTVGRIVEEFWYLFVLLLLAAIWLVRSEVSQRFFRRTVFSRFIPPVVRLRTADLLNQLSVTVNAGRPLAGAISTLARYHYDSFIRNKLLYVRNEMEQGADIWPSMAQVRLLTPAESHALVLADASDTRSWMMRKFANLKRGNVARGLSLLISFLQPALVFLFAVAVLLVAMGCLTPLDNMISGLSG